MLLRQLGGRWYQEIREAVEGVRVHGRPDETWPALNRRDCPRVPLGEGQPMISKYSTESFPVVVLQLPMMLRRSADGQLTAKLGLVDYPEGQ